MLNVGLTGNVAAGKSTVVRWFAAWGATVIDADALARDTQRPGSPVLTAITRRFGREVLGADGALDRDILRSKVMADAEALAALNAIVHPAVRRARDEQAAIAAARGDCILINEIPLLFEVLDPTAFDLLVLVDAPVAVRRGRLISQRDLSGEGADRLIASQLPAETKRARSDIVLDNGGSLEDLRDAAWRAWERIRIRAAAQAAGDGGRLLAVLVGPADASLLTGGTLARYVDAGVDVHLLCAAGDVGTLRAAAAALHVEQAAVLAAARGSFQVNDAGAIDSIGAALRRLAPTALISYGPDGIDGHPARVTVHEWTRRASGAEGATCAMYTVTVAAAAAAPPSIAGPPQGEVAAILDVRPWRDRKRAAVAASHPRPHPDHPGDHREPLLRWENDLETWLELERESYRLEAPVRTQITDFFGGSRPVDSP